MDQNICRFIPKAENAEELHTINLVLETNPLAKSRLQTASLYQIYYVRAGNGTLHTMEQHLPLACGDLFFTFPGTPFAIEGAENFEYIYISYLGSRANHITDRLGINRKNCLFHEMERVGACFEEALSTPAALSDLRCESALLYAFSLLGERLLPTERVEKTNNAVGLVRKFIDDNYSDPSLSLSSIGAALGYSGKYISTIFKSEMHIGVCDYLTTVRIQHACTLMEQGFSSVKDIASLCGFHDPLYFSKTFKKKMKLSPRKHMEELKRKH